MRNQWKRNAVVATVLLFVCAAVYLNWRYAGNVVDTGETEPATQEEDGGSTKVLGDATLVGDNGATQYFRVDWFTPDGLHTWGDGRTMILGTEGFVELRKYINIGTEDGGNLVFLANGKEEKRFQVSGQLGYPYFGQLILDCLNRTENAMTQAHAFKAAELCLQAQAQAEMIYHA